MLAAAFVLPLSALQLVACVAIIVASVALAFLIGLDEGRHRGRADLRRLDAEKKLREQVPQESWTSGRRHS